MGIARGSEKLFSYRFADFVNPGKGARM